MLLLVTMVNSLITYLRDKGLLCPSICTLSIVICVRRELVWIITGSRVCCSREPLPLHVVSPERLTFMSEQISSACIDVHLDLVWHHREIHVVSLHAVYMDYMCRSGKLVLLALITDWSLCRPGLRCAMSVQHYTKTSFHHSSKLASC